MNYRQLHQESLQQNQPQAYAQLEKSGQLNEYLNGVAASAKRLHQQVVDELRLKQPYNPVEYQDRANWERHLQQVAQEIVLQDRILVPDPETEQARSQGGYLDSSTESPTETTSEEPAQASDTTTTSPPSKP